MDYVRRLLQTFRLAPSNEELGHRASVYPENEYGTQSYPTGRRSTQVDVEEPNTTIETNEALRDFRMLVGITTHPSFKAPKGYNINQRPVITTKGRPAPNIGIYPSVVANEFKTKKHYKTFNLLISSCLGLQIIVAAALTALGAAGGNHHAVTVFGAINTIIAGFLAYLKGSGLPMRFKYYAHEWSKIREYIEQRERDFGAAQSGLSVTREVNLIRAMYEEVKGDIEANTPDRFVSNTGGHATSSVLGQGILSKSSKSSDDRDDSSEHSESGLGSMAAKLASIRNKLEGKMKDVEALEQGVQHTATAEAKKVMILTDKEAHAVVQDRAKQVGDMEHNVEHGLESYRSTMNTAFEGEKV